MMMPSLTQHSWSAHNVNIYSPEKCSTTYSTLYLCQPTPTCSHFNIICLGLQCLGPLKAEVVCYSSTYGHSASFCLLLTLSLHWHVRESFRPCLAAPFQYIHCPSSASVQSIFNFISKLLNCPLPYNLLIYTNPVHPSHSNIRSQHLQLYHLNPIHSHAFLLASNAFVWLLLQQ